jgi:RNA polymerase sigma-70 factor (ECF subfamily)
MDDHELLGRIRAHDERAFAELRSRYQAQLFAWIQHITLNQDLSEEVAQDLWLYLWQQSHVVDLSRGSFGAWLKTVARRRAVDCVRSVHASRGRDRAYGLRQIQEIEPDPEQRANLTWHRPQLKAALGQLSPRQRAAVELHHFAELSHVEAAEILGVPVGTGKTRYRDGLLKLQSLMQRAVGDEASL